MIIIIDSPVVPLFSSRHLIHSSFSQTSIIDDWWFITHVTGSVNWVSITLMVVAIFKIWWSRDAFFRHSRCTFIYPDINHYRKKNSWYIFSRHSRAAIYFRLNIDHTVYIHTFTRSCNCPRFLFDSSNIMHDDPSSTLISHYSLSLIKRWVIDIFLSDTFFPVLPKFMYTYTIIIRRPTNV